MGLSSQILYCFFLHIKINIYTKFQYYILVFFVHLMLLLTFCYSTESFCFNNQYYNTTFNSSLFTCNICLEMMFLTCLLFIIHGCVLHPVKPYDKLYTYLKIVAADTHNVPGYIQMYNHSPYILQITLPIYFLNYPSNIFFKLPSPYIFQITPPNIFFILL